MKKTNKQEEENHLEQYIQTLMKVDKERESSLWNFIFGILSTILLFSFFAFEHDIIKLMGGLFFLLLALLQ